MVDEESLLTLLSLEELRVRCVFVGVLTGETTVDDFDFPTPFRVNLVSGDCCCCCCWVPDCVDAAFVVLVVVVCVAL